MINYYLPGFYSLYKLNSIFLSYFENNKEYFYDNIQIKAFYDCFPSCIWNGGRAMNGAPVKEEIIECLDFYNKKGYACRFTFTNCLLEEKHLYDTYSNLICKLGENGLNEILVNSILLENYIRENYPKYPIISSTTKCLVSDDDFINECNKDYSLVVLDYRNNRNWELLEKINVPEKIEILLNAYCIENCKKREEHYKYLSNCQINYQTKIQPFCNDLKTNFYDNLKNNSMIKLEELDNYTKMGYFNFKIEGRTMHFANVLESYLYYMVKPEYKDELRLKILLEFC